MLTKQTSSDAALAISAWMDSRGIRRQFVADRLGLHKSVLSRMLTCTGRTPSEHLTAGLISRIALLLRVDPEIERQWLALLETPAPVAVPA